MTREEYIREINPCYGCGCYDEDMGCTMPSIDREYACPLENENKETGCKMELEFFMPMIPPACTHQEKKVRIISGKPVFYEPPQLKAARQKLMGNLVKHRPDKPIKSGVRLLVKWCFPKKEHRDGEYKTTKPDTDNLQKLLKDCMTDAGYWLDDAQVASEICEKFWAEIPGIYIKVVELP